MAIGEHADNRRSAAGALLGYSLGVGLGSVYGLVRPALGRVSTPLAGIAVGLVAMIVADTSYAVTGVSDPKTWTTPDWVSESGPARDLRSDHRGDVRINRATRRNRVGRRIKSLSNAATLVQTGPRRRTSISRVSLSTVRSLPEPCEHPAGRGADQIRGRQGQIAGVWPAGAGA